MAGVKSWSLACFSFYRLSEQSFPPLPGGVLPVFLQPWSRFTLAPRTGKG